MRGAMRSHDYGAVVYRSDVYCIGCCPTPTEDEEAYPIFADSEWDYFPVCDKCGEVHDYVTLTEDGRAFMERQLQYIEVKPMSLEELRVKDKRCLRSMAWALSSFIQAMEQYEELIAQVLDEKESDR